MKPTRKTSTDTNEIRVRNATVGNMIRCAGKGSHLPNLSPIGADTNGTDTMRNTDTSEDHVKNVPGPRHILRYIHKKTTHAKRRPAGR